MHIQFMQRCLDLAQKGMGNVSPNPMVGAVLVHDNKIIGEGYHQKFGSAHAEVNCLNSVVDKELIPFSTLYVSLEPCSHFGKTPPCANLILENKIKKVVIATTDFSSKVNGKGISLLKENGVEVIEGVLKSEAIELNKRFFFVQENKQPYVILKWAQSKDGFISKNNEQIQISSEMTNTLVHQWRHEEDAIWVGFNTANIDNPKLNVRHVIGQNPIRVILDKNLSLPTHLNLFDDSQTTFIYNFKKNENEKSTHFIKIDPENYLTQMLNHLFQQNISSVLIEGGTKLLQEIIDSNLWNEIRLINAPIELKEGVKAPVIHNAQLEKSFRIDQDLIQLYKNIKK
jgi:diaminohydroxyphosphoribosylaminopyrimidine deaminase/5-amino-6-(5-phosphoribosylamino)uracil reductase